MWVHNFKMLKYCATFTVVWGSYYRANPPLFGSLSRIPARPSQSHRVHCPRVSSQCHYCTLSHPVYIHIRAFSRSSPLFLSPRLTATGACSHFLPGRCDILIFYPKKYPVQPKTVTNTAAIFIRHKSGHWPRACLLWEKLIFHHSSVRFPMFSQSGMF